MIQGKRQHIRSRQGFSLVEAMIAVAIAAVLTAVAYTALTAHRVQNRKALEASVMQSFAETYLEYLRNQAYPEVRPARPINPLYDGTRLTTGGDPIPLIAVPPPDTWESLLADRYVDHLYPDLLLLSARNPQIRVTVTERFAGADSRSKNIRVEVRWERLSISGASAAENLLQLTLDSTIFPDFS